MLQSPIRLNVSRTPSKIGQLGPTSQNISQDASKVSSTTKLQAPITESQQLSSFSAPCKDKHHDCRVLNNELKILDNQYGHIHLIRKNEKIPKTNQEKFLQAESTLDFSKLSRRFKNEPDGHFKSDKTTTLSDVLLGPKKCLKSNSQHPKTSKIASYLAETNSFNLKKDNQPEATSNFNLKPCVGNYCEQASDLQDYGCQPFNPYTVCGGSCWYLENRSRYKRTLPSYVPLYLKNPIMREGFGYSEGDDLIDPKVVENSCCHIFCDSNDVSPYKKSCTKKKPEIEVQKKNAKDELIETLSFVRTIKRKHLKQQLFCASDKEEISNKQQDNNHTYIPKSDHFRQNVEKDIIPHSTAKNIQKNLSISNKVQTDSRADAPKNNDKSDCSELHTNNKCLKDIETEDVIPYETSNTKGNFRRGYLDNDEERKCRTYFGSIVSADNILEQFQEELDNIHGSLRPGNQGNYELEKTHATDYNAERNSLEYMETLNAIPCKRGDKKAALKRGSLYPYDEKNSEWKNIIADDYNAQRNSLKNMETADVVPCESGGKNVVIMKGYLDNGEEVYKAYVESED